MDTGALKKHIYIYSPSGAVRDKAAFKRGVRRLEWLGHEVEVDAAALVSHTRQLAMHAKTGCTTWAGPALCEGFGVSNPDDIMETASTTS